MAQSIESRKRPLESESDLNDSDIFLIDFQCHQIVSSKLPSNRDVLSILFYNLRVVKLTVRESAVLVYDEVVLFWQKARIPIRKKQRCVEKIENLHKQWRSIQKRAGKSSNIEKEESFVENSNELFDIAHKNALEMISIEQDKEFLLSQRLKGRPGNLMNSRETIIYTENKSHKKARTESVEIRGVNICEKRKSQACIESSYFDLDNIYESDEESDIQYCEADDDIAGDNFDGTWEVSGCENESSPDETATKKVQFIDSRLLSTLDAQQISDRKAVRVIIAAARALGHDVNNLVINRTTLRRLRKENREKVARAVKEDIRVIII